MSFVSFAFLLLLFFVFIIIFSFFFIRCSVSKFKSELISSDEVAVSDVFVPRVGVCLSDCIALRAYCFLCFVCFLVLAIAGAVCCVYASIFFYHSLLNLTLFSLRCCAFLNVLLFL